MRKIFRYEVPVDGQIHTLKVNSYNPRPIRIEARSDDLVEFWAEADDDYPTLEIAVTVVGTGHPIPEDAMPIGTTSRTPSGLVWHLCEFLPEPRQHQYPVGH